MHLNHSRVPSPSFLPTEYLMRMPFFQHSEKLNGMDSIREMTPYCSLELSKFYLELLEICTLSKVLSGIS